MVATVHPAISAQWADVIVDWMKEDEKMMGLDRIHE